MGKKLSFVSIVDLLNTTTTKKSLYIYIKEKIQNNNNIFNNK